MDTHGLLVDVDVVNNHDFRFSRGPCFHPRPRTYRSAGSFSKLMQWMWTESALLVQDITPR